MARSEFTVEELQAQAMLLGMWDDYEDHTFNTTDINGSSSIDADTHEELYTQSEVVRRVEEDRFQLVATGQLGASNYDQWKAELLGYVKRKE